MSHKKMKASKLTRIYGCEGCGLREITVPWFLCRGLEIEIHGPMA
jgi:hypothetical protein